MTTLSSDHMLTFGLMYTHCAPSSETALLTSALRHVCTKKSRSQLADVLVPNLSRWAFVIQLRLEKKPSMKRHVPLIT